MAENASSGKGARTGEIGSVLFHFQSMANPSDLIVCFAPWVMLELNVRAAEEGGGTWKTAHSRLLYDRRGLGAQALAQADEITFQLDAVKARIENLARALPALCTVIWGYRMRGEIVTAMSDMGWLRDQLLSVSSLVLGLWDEGPRRAERRLPPEVLGYYQRCYPCDATGLASALEAALQWYEAWLVPRLDACAIPHSHAFVQTARDFVSVASR